MKKSGSSLVGAIDVGTSKVCTLIGRKKASTIEILGIGLSSSRGIKKGKIVDIGQVSEAVRESFALAVEIAKVVPSDLYVGISGDYVTSLNLESEVFLGKNGREITSKDVVRAMEGSRAKVDLTARKVIHILTQEYLLDDETGVVDPVGMVASKLKARVHLVLAQENQFQSFVKVFRQAGLEISQAVFQPFASSLSVLTPMEKEMGTALIDMGGGTTDLTLFYGGSIRYSKVLPVGGEHLTSDLAIGMRTYRDEAERVKLSYGCAFSSHIRDDELIEVRDLGSSSLKTMERKYVCKIIEARIREIFLLLGREMKASGLFSFLRGGVVITGGSALLESIADFASSFLKLPARIGYPDSKNYVGMVQSISNPIFSTACGILQFAFREKRDQRDITSLFLGLEEKSSRIINWLKDFFMMG